MKHLDSNSKWNNLVLLLSMILFFNCNDTTSNDTQLVQDLDLQWAKPFISGLFAVGNGVAALPDASFVVAGRFQSDVLLGQGEPNETLWIDPDDDNNNYAFVAKYNVIGSLIWAKKIDGDYSNAEDVAILSDNSVVVLGDFHGSIVFDKGNSNETVLTVTQNETGYDPHNAIFIAKYYPDGTLAWAKKAGGSNTENAKRIIALSDDTVLVLSESQSDEMIFDEGGSNEIVLLSPGAFIAKFDSAGNPVWAVPGREDFKTHLNDIAAFPDGSFLVGGFGHGSDFDEERMLVMAFTTHGTIDWTWFPAGGIMPLNGTRLGNISGITVLHDGGFAITGTYAGTMIFDEGGECETAITSTAASVFDAFIVSFSANKTFKWARTGANYGPVYTGRIDTSDAGTIITSGYFFESISFGDNEKTYWESTQSADAVDSQNYYVVEYDSNGTLLYAERSGQPSALTHERNFDICYGSDGSIVTTGTFTNSSVFGDGDQHETTLLNSSENEYGFVAKYYYGTTTVN